MKKQTTWDGKEVLLVEVRNGAADFEIIGNSLLQRMKSKHMSHAISNELPSTTYRFAFTSPLSPTEAEAVGWVDADAMPTILLPVRWYPVYKDYMADGNEMDLDTALSSLSSRIRSEGFENPERVVVLVTETLK